MKPLLQASTLTLATALIWLCVLTVYAHHIYHPAFPVQLDLVFP